VCEAIAPFDHSDRIFLDSLIDPQFKPLIVVRHTVGIQVMKQASAMV
jgi:hypothetical protein